MSNKVNNEGKSAKIQDVIKGIFDEFGVNIINDPKRFLSLVADDCPQLKLERNILENVVESSIVRECVIKKDFGILEQKKAIFYLVSTYGISDEWAKRAVGWIAYAIGSQIIEKNESASPSQTAGTSNKNDTVSSAEQKKNAPSPRTKNSTSNNTVTGEYHFSKPQNKHVNTPPVVPSPRTQNSTSNNIVVGEYHFSKPQNKNINTPPGIIIPKTKIYTPDDIVDGEYSFSKLQNKNINTPPGIITPKAKIYTPDDIVDGEYSFSKSQNKHVNTTSGVSSPRRTKANNATKEISRSDGDKSTTGNKPKSKPSDSINSESKRKKSQYMNSENFTVNDYKNLIKLKDISVPKKTGLIWYFAAFVIFEVIAAYVGSLFGGPTSACIGAFVGLVIFILDAYNERKTKLIRTESGVRVKLPKNATSYYVLALNGEWVVSGVYSGYEINIDKTPAKVVIATMKTNEKSPTIDFVKEIVIN